MHHRLTVRLLREGPTCASRLLDVTTQFVREYRLVLLVLFLCEPLLYKVYRQMHRSGERTTRAVQRCTCRSSAVRDENFTDSSCFLNLTTGPV